MVIGKFMVGKEKHVVVKMDHATHTMPKNVLNGGELFWIVNRKGKYQNLKVGCLLQWEL